MLAVADTVALDDDDDLARLVSIDAVADTVGGDVAARLLGLVRRGGHFGYASVLPQEAANRHRDVVISRVFAAPDPQALAAFAKDVRDGLFSVPVSRRMPLRQPLPPSRLWRRAAAARSF